MGNLHSTCVKTPKGIEEVERKAHGLALKSRQMLIMIDGKRDLAALQIVFAPAIAQGILDDLLAGGFVRKLDMPKAAPPPLAPPPPPDEDAFVVGQTFMINTARTLLGLAGKAIIAQVGAATDVDALRELFPAWRAALRQSPDGTQRMAEIEKKLFKLLGELSVPTVAVPPVKPNGATAVRPSNDEERFEMARNFMANSAGTYLGLAAKAFVGKVEAATSLDELRHLFFEWRESLRQSPDAKRRLAEFESKLAALLS